MASTYEVTVVRARMPKSRAVLASIYVDGDVIGRTSRRRRVREPVWDRTFGLEVAEDKSLQTKVVFQEQVNNAASIVGTVELDGRELCAKTGEWRGWIKERKTISLISHRFAALIELRLAKPGEGPSPRAQICAVEDDDGCGNDQIIVDTATYCEVHYGGALIGVTRVVKGSLSPEWNGNFHYALSYGGRPCSLKNKNKKLVVRVMNRHKTAEDAFLGEARRTASKQWYRLTAARSAVVSGDVQVAVRFDAAFENDEQARPPGAFFEHYADPDLRALKLLGDLWDELDEENDGTLSEEQFVALYQRLASENFGEDDGRAKAFSDADESQKMRSKATSHVEQAQLPAPDWKEVADGTVLTFADARRVLDKARGLRSKREHSFRVTGVTLHRGLNLVAKDGGGLFSLTPGSSDPYVKVFLGGALLSTTDIVYKTLDPTFELKIDCDVLVTDLEGTSSTRDDDDDDDDGVFAFKIFDRDRPVRPARWSRDDGMGLVSIDIGATLHRAFLKAQRERKYHVAVANDRRSATHRAFYDVLPSKGCHHATGQLEVSLDYAVLGKDGDEAEPGTPAKASAASNKEKRESLARTDKHWAFCRGPCDVVFNAEHLAETTDPFTSFPLTRNVLFGEAVAPPSSRGRRWLALGPRVASRDIYLRFCLRMWHGEADSTAAPHEPTESVSIHWAECTVDADRGGADLVLSLVTERYGTVELHFDNARECREWWTKIVNVRDRTLRLGLDTDPRCWTGVSRRDRSSLARLTSFRVDPGLAPPAASDGRRAGVLAEIADRVANRVTGAPRTARPAQQHVELGPRVFAYKSGYNHNVSVVARTDFAVQVPQRRGATVRASLWVPQRAGETEGVREHLSVVLYCGSNQRSGRLDCVASHALTVCLELGWPADVDWARQRDGALLRRCGLVADDVDVLKAVSTKLFRDTTEVLIIGDEDDDVLGAEPAIAIADGVRGRERRSGDDDDDLLLVRGRSKKMKDTHQHAPRALAEIAGFIATRLGAVFIGARLFTHDPPRGIKPTLTNGTPPWETHDIDANNIDAVEAAKHAAHGAAAKIQAKRRSVLNRKEKRSSTAAKQRSSTAAKQRSSTADKGVPKEKRVSAAWKKEVPKVGTAS
ncbi:hypothetical protein JL721_4505 [Aureococcus anophagefferens]|nr:hypothetical protein JL721_4505 [Aureococcus anophagefferens]